ncbi:RNA ligase family protein [Sporolactobacillus laevolacticus]|uniref:DNA ligase (ATP) n=1 Tax=Sporolactobacillus laevolacticus DSM 442 TaxID=1395513 RepID=V6IXG3_9BACL|nr:RNA ligase family protein [Sporolactobacillus laevolacticus]EST12032.1 DNA ligase [Sporolactobacillus laevolacticus DSM 442]
MDALNLKPIVPFEPVTVDEIPDSPKWIHQVKWDGVRILTYYDGKEVLLYNRKMNERTQNYPEITDISKYCTAQTVVLDGEVIALGSDGKPSFHEVMRRDGIRKYGRVTTMMETVPIFYMIFDVIYFNGKWVNDRPLKERQILLSSIILPTQNVQIVSSQPDGKKLFEVMEDQNMEGIVSKRMDSTYVLSGKDSRWRKIKNYKDLIAVIGGVTYRQGIVNSILLGLYNEENELVYIGHAGTGKLSNTEWEAFTRLIDPLKIKERPFINAPEKAKSAQWIKPTLTVKVQYIEWPEGHSLRQPSIQAFVDYPAEKCSISTGLG